MTQLWRPFRPSWSRWAVFVYAIVMSCVAGSASDRPANRESSKAAPPPPADVQARVDGEVRELFKAQFAQTSSADRIALAKLLRAKAQESGQDRAARFVLLREARDLAAAVGDVGDALGAADELAAGFSFDTLKAKRAVLKTLAMSITGAKAQRAFVAACLTTSEEAATRDDYEAAVWLCDLAESKARLVHDPQLTARVNVRRSEILRQKRESAALKPAAERVRANRGSPEDDLAVGRFMCFDRDNWDEGLPLLANGSDPRLQAVARQELSNPTGSESRKRLADQWWALADQEPDLKSAMRRRAAHWYSLAADGLHGLDLALANQRITEEVQAEAARYGSDASAPHWVSRNATYTVSSVDPGKDPLHLYSVKVFGFGRGDAP